MRKPKLESDVIEEVLLEEGADWFNLHGRGEIFLRKSRQVIHGEKRDSLVIADVIVKGRHRRKGVFTQAVAVVEEIAVLMGLMYVYVESILNPVLVSALERLGYTVERTSTGPLAVGNTVLPGYDYVCAFKRKMLANARQTADVEVVPGKDSS